MKFLILISMVMICCIKLQAQQKRINQTSILTPIVQLAIKEQYDNSNYQKAKQLASKAIKLNPNNYLAYYVRGNAAMYINPYDYDSVYHDFTASININRQFAPAYEQRALLEQTKQPINALEDYTNAIQYNKEPQRTSYLYRDRANLKIDLLDWVGALIDINHSLKINNKDADALINRAQIYIEYNRYIEAIDDCNIAISLNQSNAFAYYYRGLAKAKLGKESACDDLKMAKKLIETNQFNSLIEKYCNSN